MYLNRCQTNFRDPKIGCPINKYSANFNLKKASIANQLAFDFLHFKNFTSGSPKQNHNKELLMKIRSKSVDRTNEAIAKKSKILASLRKYISLDDQNRLANMPYGIHGLLQSPIQCKPNNNEEIALNNLGFGTNLSSRRCSVPVTLNFQRHKINTVPVVSACNMSKRRSSLIGHHIAMEPHMSGIQFPDPAPEGQFYEVKRRVRMINRH